MGKGAEGRGRDVTPHLRVWGGGEEEKCCG